MLGKHCVKDIYNFELELITRETIIKAKPQRERKLQNKFPATCAAEI